MHITLLDYIKGHILSIKISKKINISQNLKLLRNYKEITLQQLADILNQKYNSTKQYEFDNIIPPIDILIKMSDYFEFSIDSILLFDNLEYIKNIKLISLAEKIDKMTPDNRYKIESTIETLLKSINSDLQSNQDNVDIQLTDKIHENIKNLREKKALSQRELSKVFNKSSSFINQYEIGKNKPSPENLIKLSGYFNISIHALITGQKLFFNFINKAFENAILKADKQLSLEDQKFIIKLMNKIIESS